MHKNLDNKLKLVKKLKFKVSRHKHHAHKHRRRDLLGSEPKLQLGACLINSKNPPTDPFKFRTGGGIGISATDTGCAKQNIKKEANTHKPLTPQLPLDGSEIQSVTSDILEDSVESDESTSTPTIPLIIGVVAVFSIVLLIALILGGLLMFSMFLESDPPQEAAVAKSDASTILRELSSTTTTASTTSTSTSSTTSTSTTPQLIICKAPYIRFGLGCCLDVNGNRICDSDEYSTTTLSDYIFCSSDAQCGATRVEYACRNGDVHRLTFTFFCRHPGARTSTCERNVIDDTTDICSADEQCVSGRDKCQKNWVPSNF
ncbi:MAG: hypothetical protein V1744_00430 [Candidatus Altiarchaeota archaeon]